MLERRESLDDLLGHRSEHQHERDEHVAHDGTP